MDFNMLRYRDDRTPARAPYVYINDFKDAIRRAFTSAIAMNASTGHEDRGRQNVERVRLLNSKRTSELRFAPPDHREAGGHALVHDSQGYVAREGR